MNVDDMKIRITRWLHFIGVAKGVSLKLLSNLVLKLPVDCFTRPLISSILLTY